MRFLIDAQLPLGLVGLFRKAGHEAAHVADVGLLTASDDEIRRYAIKSRIVVVTKDEDFAVMRRFATNAPQVIWIRIGNTTNDALKERLQSRLAEIVAALADGEEVVEVR